MGLSVPGLVTSVLFYALIVAVGFWGARRRLDRGRSANPSEDLMLGGRSVGLVVGVFTIIATWVDGGLLSGIVEETAVRGVLWCQAPVCFALSLLFVGAFFSGPMWRSGYVTLLDPLEKAFGSRVAALLFLPALVGEIFWCGAILNALGATVSVITGLGHVTCVLVAASVVMLYTCVGGLYSITYTDVLQLVLMFVGLWASVPFAMSNEHLRPLGSLPPDQWLGTVLPWQVPSYVDNFLMIVFGGVPWQNVFQRVLSAKTEFRAKALPYAGCVGTLVLCLPVLLLGLVARAARWQDTSYTSAAGGTRSPLEDESQWSLLLPLTLQHLTPKSVSVLGQGAVAAAAMSSADACMLSSGALFTKNVYVPLLRPKASETEKVWVLRSSIAATAVMSSAMAVSVDSVYGLSILIGDPVYVILFPQLLAVVHFPSLCNAYGSLVAFLVGLALRVIGGEPVLGLPALFRYPFFDETTQLQLFPFKTVAMLISLATLVMVSAVAKAIFRTASLPPRYDLVHCQFTGAVTCNTSSGEETTGTKGDAPVVSANSRSRMGNSQTEAVSSV
ncbi:high-affinity choline transporter 1 [Ixodes scapularis]|uniref:high-affinity choline transporter 1 n=1 Tax=Ixodes scapularis TaxID=6945 RepID=UPI001A9D5C7A|nr:high-affinity choline transporter 1 [Ixodes scapularis]